MRKYNLDQTLEILRGPTKEQIKVGNQWAAVALDKFHLGSKAKLNHYGLKYHI